MQDVAIRRQLYNNNPASGGFKTCRKRRQKYLYTPMLPNIASPKKKKRGPGYGHDTTEFLLLLWHLKLGNWVEPPPSWGTYRAAPAP